MLLFFNWFICRLLSCSWKIWRIAKRFLIPFSITVSGYIKVLETFLSSSSFTFFKLLLSTIIKMHFPRKGVYYSSRVLGGWKVKKYRLIDLRIACFWIKGNSNLFNFQSAREVDLVFPHVMLRVIKCIVICYHMPSFQLKIHELKELLQKFIIVHASEQSYRNYIDEVSVQFVLFVEFLRTT